MEGQVIIDKKFRVIGIYQFVTFIEEIWNFFDQNFYDSLSFLTQGCILLDAELYLEDFFKIGIREILFWVADG